MRSNLFLVFALLGSTQPCIGQTSVALVRSDTLGQYGIMKQAVAQEWKKVIYSGKPRASRSYELTSCVGAVTSMFSGDNLTSDLAVLAAEVRLASLTLEWAGYPREIWQPVVGTFEKKLLQGLEQGKRLKDLEYVELAKQAQDKLLEFRTTRPTLPSISWEVACGGWSELTLKVVTNPKGGVVKMIPSLFYSFCDKQGVKASSFKECDQWTKVSDGEEITVVGAYYYEISWSNGPSFISRKDFSSMPDTAKTWMVAK